MKRLININYEFEAEKIVKTDSSIIGYIDGVVVFEFNGVNDFSRFVLSDGQEFDELGLTDSQRIAQLEVEKSELMLATLDLADLVSLQQSLLQEQQEALLDLANTIAEVTNNG